MGSGLSDGISQGAAGPDEFRTAPLWGLGKRIYFLQMDELRTCSKRSRRIRARDPRPMSRSAPSTACRRRRRRTYRISCHRYRKLAAPPPKPPNIRGSAGAAAPDRIYSRELAPRSMSELRLGDVIDDYCVKCRRITNHSIVSIMNGEAAKVRCRTCYHDHDYRHEQAPPSKKDLKKAELFNEVLSTVAQPAAGETLAPVEAPSETGIPVLAEQKKKAARKTARK